MGATHYPEEAPTHRYRRRLLDRPPAGDQRSSAFVKATGTSRWPRRPRPGEYPGALPEMMYAGSLVFVPPSGPVDRRDRATGGIMRGADGAIRPGRAARWRRDDIRSSTSPTGTPRRTRRGRARRCRPRRSGNSPRAAASRTPNSLGRRVRAGRATDGEYLAGRVPVGEPGARRLRRHVAGRLPAQRLRAARHDRQRVGVDHRLVPPAARPRGKACCIPRNPRGGAETKLRPLLPKITFRARSSRAARTCARPTTAAATGRRRAFREP